MRQELQQQFERQRQFCQSYSPLYAALFGTVAGWLAEEPPGAVAEWLVEAAAGGDPFSLTNLLAAALHRDVLAGVPAAAGLAAYYPGAGGKQAAALTSDGRVTAVPAFQEALAAAILPRRAELANFLAHNTVQTNETRRGLAWLLPAMAARLEQVHLVDLGASAGLNLLADQRYYALHDSDGLPVAGLGEGAAGDLSTLVSGWPEGLDAEIWRSPQVLSRTGGDLHPFHLAGAEDELTLASFVWADQVERLRRLRTGIEVYKKAKATAAPVQLHELALPEGLPRFLAEHVRHDERPVICYNTYIRMYLPEKGAALRGHLAAWAQDQARPVLWAQWEPPSCLVDSPGAEPAMHWLAWTVDLWDKGQHRRWFLGWVHPHGHEIRPAPGFASWAAAWR